MDDVFNTPPGKEEGQGEAQQTEQQVQQPEQGAQEQPQGEQGAAPPAADTRHVPLEALEAERKGRQDWKEKATRYEEQLKAREEELARLRAQGHQPQNGDQRQLSAEEVAFNYHLHTCELLVRDKHPDVDEVMAIFNEAAARNPLIRAQALAQKNPWQAAYDEGKRLKFAAEIGNDPEAYRKKVEAEIRAQLASSTQSQQPAAPAVPQSLAGARSAGARGTTFTGPTPLSSIFPN